MDKTYVSLMQKSIFQKSKKFLLDFLFGPRATPVLQSSELQLFRQLPNPDEIPIRVKELASRLGWSRLRVYRGLDRLLSKGVVERYGEGYRRKSVRTPVGRYEAIFFLYGLLLICLSVGLRSPPLAFAGIGVFILARLVRIV